MIDITGDVQKQIESSEMKSGICTVFIPGSTAGLITIEFEGGLLKDFPDAMERLAPRDITYEHHLRWRDGNGHSHIRSSIIGPSLTIPFVNGKLTLGTWQQIAYVDFDNRSREREVQVMILGE
jgi:secondary thiamine-phosphate synthase enzyme